MDFQSTPIVATVIWLDVSMLVMGAAKKLDEAQQELSLLTTTKDPKITRFVRIIQDVYDTLLDEYSKKFGCGSGRTSLAKFKTSAKKAGNVHAINFLIWYEKEFRSVRNDPLVGNLLDSNSQHDSNDIKSCSILLELTRNLVYHAYENF